MIEAYSKKEIRNTLYSLKKEWGCKVTYVHIVQKERNIKTGVASEEYQYLIIRRAIVLPSSLMRKIAALTGTPFNYGGDYNSKERFLIVAAKDFTIPLAEIAPVDYVVLGEAKYSIKREENFDFDTAFVFRINHIPPKEL